MKFAKVSVEKICNLTCGYCSKWWSISDYKPEPGGQLYCTHCGEINLIPDCILTGEDFLRGNNPDPNATNELEDLRSYCLTLRMGLDRAVYQEGELAGYWQTEEWLLYLWQLADPNNLNPLPKRRSDRP